MWPESDGLDLGALCEQLLVQPLALTLRGILALVAQPQVLKPQSQGFGAVPCSVSCPAVADQAVAYSRVDQQTF